jgi:hypothetical protein
MLFPVTLIGLTFIYRWRPLSYGLRAAVIIAAAFFLTIFPWGMRNYLQYGHFSLTDVNGFNMLLVNAAYTETARTGKTFVQVQDEFLALAAQRGVTEKTNPFVRSDVYRQLATEYLNEHRLLFLRRYAVGMGTLFLNLASTDTADLLGLKRIQFQYNIYEFNKFSNMIVWYFRNKTGPEMLIGMPIALFLLCIYLFCLTGMFGAVQRKEYLPLLFSLGIMAYFVAVTGLFGMARYRLPLIPFYLPYAAMGSLKLKEYLDRRAARPEGDARCRVELLHEEPAAPDPRRHRVQPRRGVHPRRGQRDARRNRGAQAAQAAQAREPCRQPRRGGGQGRPRQGCGRRVSPALDGDRKGRDKGLGAPVQRRLAACSSP